MYDIIMCVFGGGGGGGGGGDKSESFELKMYLRIIHNQFELFRRLFFSLNLQVRVFILHHIIQDNIKIITCMCDCDHIDNFHIL